MKKSTLLVPIAAAVVLLSAACSAPAPQVTFTAPANGATVANPVLVKWAAQNFRVEPAGAVNTGAGHLHIMVDMPCVPAGQQVINDAAHLHYGKAQMQAELTLSPGPHTLCLQAADGAHIALAGTGMTQQISINVQ
jgi:hypothetical protein